MHDHQPIFGANALSDPDAPKRLTRIILVPVVLIALFFSLQIAPVIFNRQSVTLTITDIYASRECRSSRSIIQGPRHRSEGGGGLGHYCGFIHTDHGSFNLRQSERLPLFGLAREEMFDLLKVGCTYDIVVAGYGAPLAPGKPMTNGAIPTLISATPVSECPD